MAVFIISLERVFYIYIGSGFTSTELPCCRATVVSLERLVFIVSRFYKQQCESGRKEALEGGRKRSKKENVEERREISVCREAKLCKMEDFFAQKKCECKLLEVWYRNLTDTVGSNTHWKGKG